MKLRPVLLTVLLFAVLLVAGCAGRTPEVIEKLVTVEVPVEVTVVETQVVEVTRQVEKTVVVTATPTPTPIYVSRINVPKGTLVYPLTGEPATLDPQEAVDDISTLVAQQLYEGLFNMRGDGTLVPAAATGFQASDDSKVYTVTLRAGMTWTDGQPVTAQQYVDGVCRLLDPSLGNSYYYLLSEIAMVAGAQDYASGELADCKKVGIKAVDDLTLQITLERPAAFLPQLLAFRIFWPARLDLLAASTSKMPPPTASEFRNPKFEIVSNGPYTLAEWQPGKRIVLTRNPAYWNAPQVSIERIEFPVLPDLAAQFALYEKGDAQVAEFPPEETPRIQAEPYLSQELQVLVRPGISYLGLNTQVSPTLDVNFRRAVASAIDRQALIEEVLKQPWHKPARAVVPPGVPGYQGDDPTVGYPYDLEAARKYLAEAGYGEKNPPPVVEIWYNREGSNRVVFEAIAAMLERAGIPTRLVSSKWEDYLTALEACNPAASLRKPDRTGATGRPADCSYNLYRMGWVMEYADPAGILSAVFSPKSAFQYTGWQSKPYEELLAKALAEPDEATRTDLYRQAEKILLNEAVAVIPLQYYDRTILIKAGVTFDYPPLGAPNLQFWRLPAGPLP